MRADKQRCDEGYEMSLRNLLGKESAIAVLHTLSCLYVQAHPLYKARYSSPFQCGEYVAAVSLLTTYWVFLLKLSSPISSDWLITYFLNPSFSVQREPSNNWQIGKPVGTRGYCFPERGLNGRIEKSGIWARRGGWWLYLNLLSH